MTKNFKIESDWTTPIKPSADKERKEYKLEKQSVIDKIMKIRRKKINELKKQELKQRETKRKENIERIRKSQLNQKDNDIQAKLSEKENAQLTIAKGSVAKHREAIKQQLNNKNKKTF